MSGACDLSPDGELLVYFATSYLKPLRTWTAVSRPPYLTALALWPKGDAWGGGGLFRDNRTLQLNCRPGGVEMQLDPRFVPPATFRVEPLGGHPRRSFSTAELSSKEIKAIAASRMDPRLAHLDELLDPE
jgi:hypothetical protein